MQRSLTLSDFYELLEYDWYTTPIYYPSTKDYYKDLLSTGCRPLEPFLIDRWYTAGDYVTLMPLKGNYMRTFNINSISNTLLDAIINKEAPYTGLTLSQVRLQYKRQFPLTQLYVQNKPIDLYAFRYFKAKSLQAQGYTTQQIQSYFGWTNNSIVAIYTGANIYTA